MNTRNKKYSLKRGQIKKMKILAGRIIKILEDNISNQPGDYVIVSKRNLRWLIDLINWKK